MLTPHGERGRVRAADVAILLIVTATLLAVIEIVARFVVTPPSDRDALRLLQGDDAVSQTLAYLEINLAPLDKDVEFLWRNRPSVDKRQPMNPQPWGRPGEWTIQTNARGLRAPGGAGEDGAANVFRILCVGDSVTFGFNVDQEDAYPQRLQAALRTRYPNRAIEVVNAGTPGWSWVQGVLFLEREGLAMAPDVVVMAHGANDRFFRAKVTDRERLGRLRPRSVRWLESLRLLLEQTGTYRLVQRWFAPAADDGELSPGCRRQIDATGACRRVALDEIEEAVATANHVTRDAGVGLVVLNLDFEETDAVSAVRRAVRRERIHFVDVVARRLDLRRTDEAARAERLGLAPARMPQWRRGAKADPTRVLFRVLAPAGTGSMTVEGRDFMTGEPFEAVLVDDGSVGDERGGDAVWSRRVDAVPGRVLLYRYLRDGVPEFLALPPLPSTQGDRRRRVYGDMVLPVEVFGDRYLMAESMHPDARGHELIVQSLLEVLPLVDQFAHWSRAEN